MISEAGKKAAELSFPFLRENRVPVVLIGLRDRFLTLAPAIIRGCGRLWLSFSLGWRFNRSFAFLRSFDRSAFLRRRLLFRRSLRFLVVTSHQFSRLFWLFSPVATPAHKPPTHLRSVGLRLATRELGDRKAFACSETTPQLLDSEVFLRELGALHLLRFSQLGRALAAAPPLRRQGAR